MNARNGSVRAGFGSVCDVAHLCASRGHFPINWTGRAAMTVDMDYQPDDPSTSTGIRVLDLSRLVSGNIVTHVFADHGAEVIKVERPGIGDDMRNSKSLGHSAHWKAYCRNKKVSRSTFARARGVPCCAISSNRPMFWSKISSRRRSKSGVSARICCSNEFPSSSWFGCPAWGRPALLRTNPASGAWSKPCPGLPR